eukprot:2551363-Prymnesium_polylepis.1
MASRLSGAAQPEIPSIRFTPAYRRKMLQNASAPSASALATVQVLQVRPNDGIFSNRANVRLRQPAGAPTRPLRPVVAR